MLKPAFNVETDEVMEFDCDAISAVIRAYLYSTGRRNTWTWEQDEHVLLPQVECGRYTVVLGSWWAML